MVKIKKWLRIKRVVSLTIAIVFLFSNLVYAKNISLRLPLISQSQKFNNKVRVFCGMIGTGIVEVSLLDSGMGIDIEFLGQIIGTADSPQIEKIYEEIVSFCEQVANRKIVEGFRVEEIEVMGCTEIPWTTTVRSKNVFREKEYTKPVHAGGFVIQDKTTRELRIIYPWKVSRVKLIAPMEEGRLYSWGYGPEKEMRTSQDIERELSKIAEHGDILLSFQFFPSGNIELSEEDKRLMVHEQKFFGHIVPSLAFVKKDGRLSGMFHCYTEGVGPNSIAELIEKVRSRQADIGVVDRIQIGPLHAGSKPLTVSDNDQLRTDI